MKTEKNGSSSGYWNRSNIIQEYASKKKGDNDQSTHQIRELKWNHK